MRLHGCVRGLYPLRRRLLRRGCRLTWWRGILTPDELSQMVEPVVEVRADPTDPVPPGYAFGHVVTEREDGGRWIWHSGGSPGASAIFLVDPALRIGLTLIANAEGNGILVIKSIVTEWSRAHGLEPPRLY